MVVLLAVGATAQTSSPRDYSLTVSGSYTWTDTGIDLVAGDAVSFTANPKSGSDSACSPQGASGGMSNERPLPSASAGALIAKTSATGPASLVGASGSLQVETGGRLFLGLNQQAPSKCEFAVQVTVSRAQTAATAPTGMKEKLNSAAQVWLKGQFGTGSAQTSSSNAVSEKGAAPAGEGTSAGLKLPTVILDAELRQHIDTLPRRVHDHLGNPGDMVNFVIVGSQDRAQAAFVAADWHLADVDSKEAGLKAILDTVEKKDYLDMPMSHLYLFDRMQDFGYEQAQAISVVASRHHFRMWKAPFTWNKETVWVGAATHDIGFEKDVRTGKLTHKIDPNVDDERENLAQGLQKSGKTKGITYYLPPDPVQEAKNASGGSYHSDGRLLIVFLN
jgi:hypothetical protein